MTSPATETAFEQRISTTGKPFEVIGALGPPSVRVRFTGMFGTDKVIWDARIMTLEAVVQDVLEQGDPPPITPRQFIEIGADGADGRLITIGLHVPVIDEPTIWKTVTMIRNYKRLRLGRIEWGQAPEPRPELRT